MKKLLILTALLSIACIAQADMLLLGVGRRPAAGGGSLFSDDFNRADSSSIGASWTERVCDFEIVSNTLRTTGSGECVAHTATISQANYSVTTTITFLADTGSRYFGIYCRRVNNGASASDGYMLALNTSADVMELFEVAGGSYTSLGTHSVTLAATGSHTIKLNCNGSAISGDYGANGSNEISVTDGTFSAAGDISTFSDNTDTTEMHWDNITVDAL